MRRWFTLVSGLVECLCFSGVLFGWASLVFVLKTEGYFSSLCVNTTGVNGTPVTDCSGQDEQFSLVFTIASFMNSFLTLPNGFLFDRFGTTAARLLGILLYTMGTLFVAFSTPALSNLLFPALSFIATGGFLLLITNIQVGNLFGSHRSTVITIYNGAFDSSSALFLVIKVLVESGVSLRNCFLFLSACSIIHLLRTFLLMPRSRIPYVLPDSYTYGMTCGKRKSISPEWEAAGGSLQGELQDALRGANTSEGTPLDKESPPVTASGGKSSSAERSFRQCALSCCFLVHLLWLSVIQLRHFVFISTLNSMLSTLSLQDPALVSRYLNAFASIQLCAVLCAPWNGFIMDRHKNKPRDTVVLNLFRRRTTHTALQCVLFGACASVPRLPLQYLTFSLQVANRSFLYGGNAAFISVAFPSCHFGKLFGLAMCVSAVFSLLQYPCVALLRGALGGDPLYLNIALTLLSLLAFLHPLSVYLHCRRLADQRTALPRLADERLTSSQDTSMKTRLPPHQN